MALCCILLLALSMVYHGALIVRRLDILSSSDVRGWRSRRSFNDSVPDRTLSGVRIDKLLFTYELAKKIKTRDGLR